MSELQNLTSKCPSCSKQLMSQMSPLCLWCGAKIPEELRLSPEEIKKIDDQSLANKRAAAISGPLDKVPSPFSKGDFLTLHAPHNLHH